MLFGILGARVLRWVRLLNATMGHSRFDLVFRLPDLGNDFILRVIYLVCRIFKRYLVYPTLKRVTYRQDPVNYCQSRFTKFESKRTGILYTTCEVPTRPFSSYSIRQRQIFVLFCSGPAKEIMLFCESPNPSDFVTKMKQINLDDEFCRPVLPHNQILCLHHFYLKSLYFQSLQSISARLDPITYVGNLSSMHSISMNKQ